MTYFSALIVEDDESRAKLHSLALNELGLACSVATTVEDALIFLQNSPAYSLILSDLNFDPEAGSENTDGRKIGRWAAEHSYPGYTALCSAMFGENDEKFMDAKREFDATFPPEGGEEAYKALAAAARERSIERIRNSQLAISPDAAVESGTALKSVHELYGDPDSAANSTYFNEGYKILAVQPVTNGFPVGNPFFVWLNDNSNPVVAEVYRHPTLFATGENVGDCLGNLGEIVSSTHIDLFSVSAGGKMKFVKDFVSSIFGSRGGEGDELQS